MTIASFAAASLLGLVVAVSISCAQSLPEDLHDLPLIEVPAAPGAREGADGADSAATESLRSCCCAADPYGIEPERSSLHGL